MKGIKKKLLSIFLAMAMVFSSIPGSVVPFGVTVYAEGEDTYDSECTIAYLKGTWKCTTPAHNSRHNGSIATGAIISGVTKNATWVSKFKVVDEYGGETEDSYDSSKQYSVYGISGQSLLLCEKETDCTHEYLQYERVDAVNHSVKCANIECTGGFEEYNESHSFENHKCTKCGSFDYEIGTIHGRDMYCTEYDDYRCQEGDHDLLYGDEWWCGYKSRIAKYDIICENVMLLVGDGQIYVNGSSVSPAANGYYTTDAHYQVSRVDGANLFLVTPGTISAHEHSYELESVNGNTVTAKCSTPECDKETITLTLKANNGEKNVAYNGAKLDGDVDIFKAAFTVSEISYTDNNGTTVASPTEAGEYFAVVSVNSNELKKSFKIEEPDPEFADHMNIYKGEIYPAGEDKVWRCDMDTIKVGDAIQKGATIRVYSSNVDYIQYIEYDGTKLTVSDLDNYCWKVPHNVVVKEIDKTTYRETLKLEIWEGNTEITHNKDKCGKILYNTSLNKWSCEGPSSGRILKEGQILKGGLVWNISDTTKYNIILNGTSVAGESKTSTGTLPYDCEILKVDGYTLYIGKVLEVDEQNNLLVHDALEMQAFASRFGEHKGLVCNDFTIENGYISAGRGNKNLTLDLNGHKITQNYNNSTALIWINGTNSTNFTFINSSSTTAELISNSTSTDVIAATINVAENSHVTINGNIVIKGKSAGVRISSGTLTLKDVTITDSKCGVKVEGGTVTVKGTTKITGNTQNLYLSTGKTVTVDTPITGMDIGVSMQTPGVFTTATVEGNKTFFKSDNKGYEVTFNTTDNALMLSEVQGIMIDGNYTVDITLPLVNGAKSSDLANDVQVVLKDKDGIVIPDVFTLSQCSYSDGIYLPVYAYKDWKNRGIILNIVADEGYFFEGEPEKLSTLTVKVVFNGTDITESERRGGYLTDSFDGRMLYLTYGWDATATERDPEVAFDDEDIFELISLAADKLVYEFESEDFEKVTEYLEYQEFKGSGGYSCFDMLHIVLFSQTDFELSVEDDTYTLEYVAYEGEEPFTVLTIVAVIDENNNVTKVTFDSDLVFKNSPAKATFILPHSHGGWEYSASDNAITAKCTVDGCNLSNGETVFTLTAPENAVYDGTNAFSASTTSDSNAKFLALTGATVGNVQYVGVASTVYDLTTTAPKAAGTYKASVVVTINGTPYTAEVEFTIDKAGPTASDFTYSAPSDLAYNGQAKTATVVAKDTASQVTVKYYKDTTEVTNPTDAGTYTVKVTATAGNNHVATTEEIAVGTFTITKAAPVQNNFTYSAPSDLVYNGQAKTASVVAANGVTGLGTITVKYYKGTTEVTNPTDAGTYTVKVTTAEGDNFIATESAITVGSFTIAPKQLDASAVTLTPGTQVFTGEAITQTVEVKDGQNTLTKDVDYEVSTTGISATAYGEYSITVTFIGNYAGTANKTWNIIKTLSTLENAPIAKTELVYDGSSKDLVTAGTGVTGGTLKYSLDGETYSETVPSAKNAGEYTVWYKVCGDSNHSDTEPASVSVTIAKKPITVSGIKVVEKTYNGNTSATLNYADVTFTGLLSGEELAVEAVGTFADKNVAADKTVSIKGITLKDVTGKDYLKNYVLATEGQQATATGTIKPKDIQVAITTNGGTFAGEISPATATSTGYVEGDNAPELTLTYYTDAACTTKTSTTDGATAAGGMPTKAGTYYVKATIKSDVNYVVKDTTENPQTKTFVVAEATLDETNVNVVMSDVLFTKDDEKTHEVTVTVTYNGLELFEGKDFIVTGNRGKKVGEYTLTIEGKGDFKGTVTRNWAINEVKTVSQKVTLDESKGSLTVTVTGDESAPDVSANNLKEVLTSAELAAVKNGDMDIDVIVTVKVKKANDVNTNSLTEIKKLSSNSENITYLDITVSKVIKTLENDQVVDMKTVSITKTESGLKFTIDVPSTIPAVEQGYNRVYTVIRSHKENGVYTAEKLVTTYEAGKLSFTTDKFSDYALMYVDSKIPTNSEETKPSVSTSNVNTSYKAPNTGVNN